MVVSAAPAYRALFGHGTHGALALYRHDHDHGHDHGHDPDDGHDDDPGPAHGHHHHGPDQARDHGSHGQTRAGHGRHPGDAGAAS